MVITNVTKDYGNKHGVFGLSFDVKKGQVYGILGPNGAGKTTLIRMIMGFIKPQTGEVIIDGINTWDNSQYIMDKVGYVAGEICLLENMTGKKYFQLLKTTKNNVNLEFMDNLIKFLEIDLSTKIKKLSKGNKQKIAIVQALMHDPEYIILDEPTSGLDPLMQLKFNELILNLNKKLNKTIIICSHIFQEIASVCNIACFIKEGVLTEEFLVDKNSINEIEEKFKETFNFDANSIFK